jgi:GNAT superfamily N-acetyltransferase
LTVNPVAIVGAQPADIPIIQRLAREIWLRHYPGIISGEQIDYMLAQGYSADALMKYLTTADAGLAIAGCADAAIGFVGWCRQDAPAVMKLEKLYVLPEHHGEGVGRALIDHAVTHASRCGCNAMTLNVNRQNAGAIRAYERCGFEIRERGDFPIGGGFLMEDFIMVRRI